MQIKNSITTLCNIFPNKIFDMKTWEKYALTISPDLALKCENASKKYVLTETFYLSLILR